MNAFVWLDVALLGLLLVFAYLFYRVETNSIGNQKELAKDDQLPPVKGKKFALYPAQLIRQVGIRPQRVQGLYWSTKCLLLVLLPLLYMEWAAAGVSYLVAVALALAGFFAADLLLLSQRGKRRREITNSLNFFINLMVVYLQSGESLAQAFRQASLYGLTEDNPLAQEVRLLLKEIDAGRDREKAFSVLAERTGVEDLKRLAALIGVGFKVGAPVRETLKAQADLLKARQSQLATELVNRKSMEAMLPMMLVCFPMFIVLILFPATIQLLDVFSMLKDVF